MQQKMAIYKQCLFSVMLCISACSPTPIQRPQVFVKQWAKSDQIEIANERNALADPGLYCVGSDQKPVKFPLMLPVLDEWELTRRELR